MKLQMKILNKEFYEENNLPRYATSGSAGLDLTITEDAILLPNMTKLCGTGLAIWIGSDSSHSIMYNSHTLNAEGLRVASFEKLKLAALIIPRSGTGHKRGIILGNSTGLIDEDYTGELMLSIWNRTEFVQEIKAGERVAQMVFLPVLTPEIHIVEEFSSETTRGEGGFGHSGV